MNCPALLDPSKLGGVAVPAVEVVAVATQTAAAAAVAVGADAAIAIQAQSNLAAISCTVQTVLSTALRSLPHSHLQPTTAAAIWRFRCAAQLLKRATLKLLLWHLHLPFACPQIAATCRPAQLLAPPLDRLIPQPCSRPQPVFAAPVWSHCVKINSWLLDERVILFHLGALGPSLADLRPTESERGLSTGAASSVHL